MQKILILALALGALSGLNLATAQPAGPPPGQGQEQREGGPRQGPPPEAFAACTGKAAAAACSFTGRRGEALTGTCFSPPAAGPDGKGAKDGGKLACRPANAPQR